jgi:hypothetical protein
MKRILLSLFAALVGLAVTVPAQADDHKHHKYHKYHKHEKNHKRHKHHKHFRHKSHPHFHPGYFYPAPDDFYLDDRSARLEMYRPFRRHDFHRGRYYRELERHSHDFSPDRPFFVPGRFYPVPPLFHPGYDRYYGEIEDDDYDDYLDHGPCYPGPGYSHEEDEEEDDDD